MIPSLQNGVTALKSFSEGLQVISNNIANVNSLGYKSARANYTDTFYLHKNDPKFAVAGQTNNSTQDLGGGVKVGDLSSNFNQGVIENTGLDLDLAIEGEALPNGGGFFEVFDPVSGDTLSTQGSVHSKLLRMVKLSPGMNSDFNSWTLRGPFIYGFGRRRRSTCSQN